jgi:hypothetical protein
MTLHVTTSLSLEEVDALRWAAKQAYTSQDGSDYDKYAAELVRRVCGGLDSAIYNVWNDLPNGNHLKEAYRDRIWTVDDTDLEYLN